MRRNNLRIVAFFLCMKGLIGRNMKRLLFSAVLLLVTATFFSCSDDVKFNYNYFANPDNVARVANAFEGSYEGETRVLARGKNSALIDLPDSIWVSGWTDEAKSRPVLRYSLGGKGRQNLTVEQFPISAIGYIVDDSALADALKKAPARNLVFNYNLFSSSNTNSEHHGVMDFDHDDVSLTLYYGGARHVVNILFNIPTSYEFDIDKGPYCLDHIQFWADELYVDGKLQQSFDLFTDEALFEVRIVSYNYSHDTVADGLQTKDDK